MRSIEARAAKAGAGEGAQLLVINKYDPVQACLSSRRSLYHILMPTAHCWLEPPRVSLHPVQISQKNTGVKEEGASVVSNAQHRAGLGVIIVCHDESSIPSIAFCLSWRVTTSDVLPFLRF